MSNTLEETNSQHQRSVETLGLSGDSDNSIIPAIYEWCLDNNIELNSDQAISLSRLILSEAHRIGMEAIGGDRDYEKYGQCPYGCGMQYGCSCDSAEFRIKHEQRERLSEITGVQE